MNCKNCIFYSGDFANKKRDRCHLLFWIGYRKTGLRKIDNILDVDEKMIEKGCTYGRK